MRRGRGIRTLREESHGSRGRALELARGLSEAGGSVPVAGEFLSRGADRCSVGWVAEIDDVESRDGVGGHDRAAKRIRDGKREDGAEQGFDLVQRRDRVGREVKQAIARGA